MSYLNCKTNNPDLFENNTEEELERELMDSLTEDFDFLIKELKPSILQDEYNVVTYIERVIL